ncbi:hypothetical protein FG04599.1 [Paecilomyces variotii No. 5]|uniref:Uncharacterized protein n=1 Tax=Byssochlamys spectabilis (strain No. 5 / NBRC 109023) TaxID=1356009 RepID=V5FRY9_BYSSN|nr:hypothetical protein FG04599.1 [Paecilomyces variotii No. 5]
MATHAATFVSTFHHYPYHSISETNPSLTCEGKIVFITGGGRGIGRAIAKSFAVAGAKGTFLVGRTKSDLQTAAEDITKLAETSNKTTTVLYSECDITDAHAVASAFKKAISSFGHIDILIQNAGYLDDHRSVVDSDLKDYWKTFEINVKGGLSVIQEFLKTSPPAGSTIINVGSGAGHLPYIPGYSAYSSSKLALAKIVEYVHHENPHLRVFNINPGAIVTEMQAKAGDIAAPDDIGLAGSFSVWLAASKDADAFRGRFLWSNWDVDELKEKQNEVVSQNLLIHGLIGL